MIDGDTIIVELLITCGDANRLAHIAVDKAK